MKFRLGICLPIGANSTDFAIDKWLSMTGNWRAVENNGIVEASSLQALDDDDSKNVFFDREHRYTNIK